MTYTSSGANGAVQWLWGKTQMTAATSGPPKTELEKWFGQKKMTKKNIGQAPRVPGKSRLRAPGSAIAAAQHSDWGRR